MNWPVGGVSHHGRTVCAVGKRDHGLIGPHIEMELYEGARRQNLG